MKSQVKKCKVDFMIFVIIMLKSLSQYRIEENKLLVASLTRSCVFRDAIYPEGSICRIADDQERCVFMATKTGLLQECAEKELANGGAVVYLAGKLRLLEKGSYQIISRNLD